MDIDYETIISIILAIAVGIIIYYAYNKYNTGKIDKVYYLIADLYEKYGDKIREDNPDLARDCELALQTMKDAMEDGEISIIEAMDITKTFVPLMSRLVKFIKEKYVE